MSLTLRVVCDGCHELSADPEITGSRYRTAREQAAHDGWAVSLITYHPKDLCPDCLEQKAQRTA